MDARALQRASLGELLDEIDATFLEAGVSKQVAHLRCTSITAEVRRRLAPAPVAVEAALAMATCETHGCPIVCDRYGCFVCPSCLHDAKTKCHGDGCKADGTERKVRGVYAGRYCAKCWKVRASHYVH